MRKRKSPPNVKKSGTKKTSTKPIAKSEGTVSQNEITESAAFQRAATQAKSYVQEPARLRRLIEDAVSKINVIPRGPFAETWPYLLAMIRLMRSYHRGEYRDVPSQNLLTIVSAIIYFVSPFDVIPDWIPFFGHIDDAFVIGLALKSVRVDLDTFMAWETSKV
jgi:uncharacterized membrane protein YkvA (DUF1232 family)